MMIEMLKSKIHRATVTGADLEYNGSISIDPALVEAVGLREWEKVDVLDIDNGARLTTYVILGEPGEICVNGAAARLVQRGDRVIIAAYGQLTEEESENFRPQIVLVDGRNAIIERFHPSRCSTDPSSHPETSGGRS
ncbi:MAG: aspartate 1-decarboxylase [Thermoanaerobaculales bacterium]|jgi:aspartate 1-decarboxylase|nr:aspartate 1-decarboxylase [Thermoanaerobaculales bacterium]